VNRKQTNAVRHIDTLFGTGTIGALTDMQLLERFTSQTDETAELAFAALGTADRGDRGETDCGDTADRGDTGRKLLTGCDLCAKITHEVAITWVVGDESFQKRLRGHSARAVQRRRGRPPKRGRQAAGISS
jgi:hypothetical protein